VEPLSARGQGFQPAVSRTRPNIPVLRNGTHHTTQLLPGLHEERHVEFIFRQELDE
jgi:hypothetical protein